MAQRVWIQNPSPERLPGGHAAGKPPIAVDPWQVAQGMRVEMEHTRDPRVAYEIAVDHLYEIPDYYTRLQQLERTAGLGLSATTRTAAFFGVLALIGAALTIGLEWYGRRA